MANLKLVETEKELIGLKQLQTNNLRRLIGEEEAMKEGFVTSEYELSLLQKMHNIHPSIIVKEGDEVVGDLRDLIEEMVKGTGLEILRIKNNRLMKKTLGDSAIQETLDDLNENEVFERCLIFHKISKDQWPDLLNAYQEILTSVNEVDLNAE